MRSHTWIILDCNYLCHRAWHSTGHLSYEGKGTGVIYGFLKFLRDFRYKKREDDFVFAFDSKKNKRRQIHPGYKSHRKDKELSAEELTARREFIRQTKRLRIRYLPMIGYKNVFVQPGYEADDIIASVCKSMPHKYDNAIIVSCDKDLYQLLSNRVHIYNPITNEFTTPKTFRETYNIKPSQWVGVKAIAGCVSDHVEGVPGVGETRAIQIIRDELNHDTTTYQNYLDNYDIVTYNMALVRLPFKGVHKFNLRHDDFSSENFDKIVRSLGMKSLGMKLSEK